MALTPQEACRRLNIKRQGFKHLETQFKAMANVNGADEALEVLFDLPDDQWPIVINEKSRRLADRFADMAEKMVSRIEAKLQPMTQNPTPKRVAQYHSRRLEGQRLQRVHDAMLLIARLIETGEIHSHPLLIGLTTKTQLYNLLGKKTKRVPNGYHDYRIETDDYADETPTGRLLQRLIDGEVSEEDRRRQKREAIIREYEEKVRFTDIPGFFPTPKPIIEKMLACAGIQKGDQILEPSAGKGDICDAIREQHGKDVKISVCEMNPELRTLLELKGYHLVGRDFINYSFNLNAESGQSQKFDRILMNPPFENSQDAEHIQEAYKLLKPGGRLVAICSEGPFFRKDKTSVAFRDLLRKTSSGAEKLPADAFKAGAWRQTGVRCRMVVMDR